MFAVQLPCLRLQRYIFFLIQQTKPRVFYGLLAIFFVFASDCVYIYNVYMLSAKNPKCRTVPFETHLNWTFGHSSFPTEASLIKSGALENTFFACIRHSVIPNWGYCYAFSTKTFLLSPKNISARRHQKAFLLLIYTKQSHFRPTSSKMSGAQARPEPAPYLNKPSVPKGRTG